MCSTRTSRSIFFGGVSSPGREKVEEDELLHILQVRPVSLEVRAQSANSLNVPVRDKDIEMLFVFCKFSNLPKFLDVFPYVAPCHFLFQDINLKLKHKAIISIGCKLIVIYTITPNPNPAPNAMTELSQVHRRPVFE